MVEGEFGPQHQRQVAWPGRVSAQAQSPHRGRGSLLCFFGWWEEGSQQALQPGRRKGSEWGAGVWCQYLNTNTL